MSGKIILSLAGSAAGLINGLFGAGGGMVLVPILRRHSEISEQACFPTSIAIIAPICIVSLLYSANSQLTFGQVLPYLLGSTVGGIADLQDAEDFIHLGASRLGTSRVVKAVKAMEHRFGCRPEDIRAAIGPNIGQCCFETDSDVPEAMANALGADAKPFIEHRGEKFHVDLKGINALWLGRSGIANIEISTDCTACAPNRFWSHRITGGRRGSQGGIIVCKEGRK